MNKVEIDLLDNGIRKYRLKEYSEADFHSTLQTVIGLLTESHLSYLRQELESVEGELERIDSLSNDPRQDYLRQIEKIEKLVSVDIDGHE